MSHTSARVASKTKLTNRYAPAIRAMEALQHRLKQGQWAELGNGVGTYGPFLSLVAPDKLAVLAIHEVVNLVVKNGNTGVPLASLLINMGEAVRTEVRSTWMCLSVERFVAAALACLDGRLIRFSPSRHPPTRTGELPPADGAVRGPRAGVAAGERAALPQARQQQGQGGARRRGLVPRLKDQGMRCVCMCVLVWSLVLSKDNGQCVL